MQIDGAFLALVRPVIFDTWQQIGFDCQEFCEDNEQAVEMCIDADRLLLNGDSPEANAAVMEACVEHGYRQVLAYLASKIQLV
jgi:hypothetical protein